MVQWTSRWTELIRSAVSHPGPLYIPHKRPPPEYQEDYENYRAEIVLTAGFGVTSPYGQRLGCGILCVPSEKISHPILQDLAQFAIDDHNKSPSTDRTVMNDLSLVSMVKVNYMILSQCVAHLITLKAKDPSSALENSYYALVLTCFEGCKFSGGLCHTPKRYYYWDTPKEAPKQVAYKVENLTEMERRSIAGFEEIQRNQGSQGKNESKREFIESHVTRIENANREAFIWCKEQREIARLKRKQCIVPDPSDWMKGLIMKERHRWFDHLSTEQKLKAQAQAQGGAGNAKACEQEACMNIKNGTSTGFCPPNYPISPMVTQLEAQDQDRVGIEEVYKREVCTHIQNGSSTLFKPAPYMILTPQPEVVKPVKVTKSLTSESSYLYQVLLDGCHGLF